MEPAMYIFLNKGLGMSTGKSAAQAGHAAAEATLLSHPDLIPVPDQRVRDRWNAWREGLHYAKYVMEGRDEQHMTNIERYLIDRGFRTSLIIDEGHTEVDPLVITAMGVALVDKDDPHTRATFSSFKLYRDDPPEPPEPPVLAPLLPYVVPQPVTIPNPIYPPTWSPVTTPGVPWQRPIITCSTDDTSNTA